MLQNERMDINVLKMCSLGELILMRQEEVLVNQIPLIDYEIYSRIPIRHLVKRKEEPKRKLMKKGKRWI